MTEVLEPNATIKSLTECPTAAQSHRRAAKSQNIHWSQKKQSWSWSWLYFKSSNHHQSQNLANVQNFVDLNLDLKFFPSPRITTFVSSNSALLIFKNSLHVIDAKSWQHQHCIHKTGWKSTSLKLRDWCTQTQWLMHLCKVHSWTEELDLDGSRAIRAPKVTSLEDTIDDCPSQWWSSPWFLIDPSDCLTDWLWDEIASTPQHDVQSTRYHSCYLLEESGSDLTSIFLTFLHISSFQKSCAKRQTSQL